MRTTMSIVVLSGSLLAGCLRPEEEQTDADFVATDGNVDEASATDAEPPVDAVVEVDSNAGVAIDGNVDEASAADAEPPLDAVVEVDSNVGPSDSGAADTAVCCGDPTDAESGTSDAAIPERDAHVDARADDPALCEVEPGGDTLVPGTTAPPTCGDGEHAVDICIPEQCDDGNRVAGDGCGAHCQVENYFRCPLVGACAPMVCGDGIVDSIYLTPSEECDDGNSVANDGCDDNCRLEPGFACCPECVPTVPGDVCSNALLLPLGESNYDLNDFAGCGPAQRDVFFKVVLNPRDVMTIFVDAPEAYGRLEFFQSYGSPDECRSLRYIETLGAGDFSGYKSGIVFGDKPGPVAVYVRLASSFGSNVNVRTSLWQPSAAVCGDGLLRSTEQCDDGNVVSGDGCSSNCVIEPSVPCVSGAPDCQTLPGDTCETAEPLPDGVQSLLGFEPEPGCEGCLNCARCVPTRWFYVDVPPFHALTLSPNHAPEVALRFQRSCPDPDRGWFRPREWNVAFPDDGAYPSGALANATSCTKRVRLSVAGPEQSEFSIGKIARPLGCGDAFQDICGWFGQPEACDDGNMVNGDTCTDTCTSSN